MKIKKDTSTENTTGKLLTSGFTMTLNSLNSSFPLFQGQAPPQTTIRLLLPVMKMLKIQLSLTEPDTVHSEMESLEEQTMEMDTEDTT